MTRPRSPMPILGAALAGSLLLPCAAQHAQAQRRSVSRTTSVETEVIRRQNAALDADQALLRGDAASIRGDYDQAMRDYKAAVDALNAAPATTDTRPKAIKKFFDATIKLAEQRIIEGRYVDAEATVKVILQPQYDPDYKPALKLLKRLEDPDYFNQTITPKFIDKTRQVQQLFREAQGYYDSARFDLAFKRYEQILALDPTNIAARRGEEMINSARLKYGTAAYDHARSQALWEVSKGWERPVRRFGLDADPHRGVKTVRDDQGTVAINRKLSTILIPNIEFRQTTIRDAIEFLRQESRRLDTTEENPDNRGVNIFLKLTSGGGPARAAASVPGGVGDAAIPGLDAGTAPGAIVSSAPAASADTRITLTLSRIPLLEALRYVAQQAGLKVKVETYAVSIVPLTELTDALITAEFRVPPTFIGTVSTGGTSGQLAEGASQTGSGGGGTRDVTGAGSNTITRQDAKTFLEANGVTFPPGASATYLAATSKLVVRNTQENVDLIETLVQQSETVIRQVEIESKFVEITQTNVKELSFDVGVGQSNFPGSSKVFVGGGTSGASSTTTTGGGAIFTNPNGSNVGANPITGGLRSGGFAIQASAIDALLFGGAAQAAAPGIFSIAGVFSDPQFQVMIRALNQSKGVDLLSAPRVTTKSGQKATIEIIREFLYPTQFQPPQIPQNFGNNNNSGTSIINPLTGILTSSGGSQSFPVTPTTPTNFEKRNTGVTLEVEPVIGPDNFTIDLNLQPQVVEFEGFINYGSPIQTVSQNIMAAPVVLTQNTINQPIFNTRKVSTSVSIYDGSTVVLGGLVREDVQRANDKVPVLGDVPLVGRLFRSKVDQNIKRNLIIFVTARLIDPSGQPLTSTEEEEEIVQPLVGPDQVIVPPMQYMPKK